MTPAVNARAGGQGLVQEQERRLSHRLHTEDIVCIEGNPTLIGVVTRVHHEDEDDEDEGDLEDLDEEALEPGHVEVCWIGEPESTLDSSQGDQQSGEILDSSKLILVDRSLMHGDVVGLSANPLGQSGTVVGVDLSVDIRLANGALIQDISAKRLGHIRQFSAGCYALYQQWLGKIEEVLDDIVVCFEDGSMCEIKDVAYPVVVPVTLSATDDESMCPYWPGQVVRAHNGNVTFRAAKWLQGSWSANKQTGIVKEVKPGTITLSWRSCVKMPSGNGDLLNPPPDTIAGALLTPLTYFAYTHFQLGDRCLVPQDLLPDLEDVPTTEGAVDECEGGSPPQDTAASSITPPSSGGASSSSAPSGGPSQEPDHGPQVDGKGRKRAQKRAQQRERRRAKNQKGTGSKEKAKIESAAMIVNTRTTVDVLWQDGTKSEGVRGADLFPVEDLGDYDFWPEEYVLEREPSEEGRERQCLVKSVNAKERTAVVRWLEGELEFEQEPQFGPEEVVSVYELAEHADYDYRLGDVVTRLPGAGRGTFLKTSRQNPQTPTASGRPSPGTVFPQLEYVGEIVGLRDGLITVAWGDGLVSEVGPQEILVASTDDDLDDDVDDDSFYASDEDGDAESWETLSADGSQQEAAPQEDPANELVQRWQQAEATFAALNGAGPLPTGTSRFGEEALWSADDFPPLTSNPPAVPFNPPQLQPPVQGAPTPWGQTRSGAPGDPPTVPPRPLGLPGVGLRFLGRVMAGAGGWLMYGSEDVAGLTEVGPGVGSVLVGSGVAPAGEAEEERSSALTAKDAENTEGGRSDVMPAGEVEEARSDLLSGESAEKYEDGRSDMTPVGEAETREGESSAVVSAGDSAEHMAGNEAKVAGAQRSGEAAGGVVEEKADEACVSETEAAEHAQVEPGATAAVSLGPSAPAQSGSTVGEAAGAMEEEGGGVSTSWGASSQLSAKQVAVVKAAGEKLCAMKHFELMTTAPEDHKFLDQLGQATNPRRWAKRIQTEWAALEASLPDSIYIHVYEGRMDLMRAVIVGAAGTPYHDNLFFFDFHFPPEYPNSPPLAQYHSGGLRVNPNLYESGKVCLSLLNTWNGKGTELWDSTSSMLQVLISLQGLVLVSKPYFNEAGYEKQMGTIEGEKNSLVYNESSYLLVCKSMQYLIKRPPKGFEELVQCFYQLRAPVLLGSLASYLSGKRVGSLPDWKEDGASTSQQSESTSEAETGRGPKEEKHADANVLVEKSLADGGCSFGFRIVLGKMAPKLRSLLVELLDKGGQQS